MKTPRKTKATRGYELLREAACTIEMFWSSQLFRIAKAINPELQDFQGRLVVLDDMRWLDEPRLSGSLTTLSRHGSVMESEAKRALVFFREEARAEASRICAHDVRLCYEFSRNEKGGTVWLDVETGLPWTPQSCFSFIPDQERCRRLNDQQASDTRLARAVIAQLTEEENTRFGWQYGDADYRAEREIEVLQFIRRKNKNAPWVVEKTYATRYHPAGSMLPKEDQEAFRLSYLEKQREAVAA